MAFKLNFDIRPLGSSWKFLIFVYSFFQRWKLKLKLKEKPYWNCGKKFKVKLFSPEIAMMIPHGNSSAAFNFLNFIFFIQNHFFGYFFKNCCGFVHEIEKWCIMRRVMYHRGRPIMNTDVIQTFWEMIVATHPNTNILAHSFIFPQI